MAFPLQCLSVRIDYCRVVGFFGFATVCPKGLVIVCWGCGTDGAGKQSQVCIYAPEINPSSRWLATLGRGKICGYQSIGTLVINQSAAMADFTLLPHPRIHPQGLRWRRLIEIMVRVESSSSSSSSSGVSLIIILLFLSFIKLLNCQYKYWVDIKMWIHFSRYCVIYIII